MNWDAIGAVGEVAGAIAVVATLFYLANQIRLSSTASSADAERQLLAVWDEAFKELSATPEISELMLRGIRDVANLSEEELYMFITRLTSIVSAHYTMYQMRNHNFLSESTRDGTDNAVAWLLKSQGGQFWWKHVATAYPKEHRNHVQQLMNQADIEPYDEWWNRIANDLEDLKASRGSS